MLHNNFNFIWFPKIKVSNFSSAYNFFIFVTIFRPIFNFYAVSLLCFLGQYSKAKIKVSKSFLGKKHSFLLNDSKENNIIILRVVLELDLEANQHKKCRWP